MTALASHEISDCGVGTDGFDDAALSKSQRIVSGQAGQSWHQEYISIMAASFEAKLWAACESPSLFAVFLLFIPSQHYMSPCRLPDNS